MTNDLTTVAVGEYTVGVRVATDDDGSPFVELVGVDCNLEGELPGVYYPTGLDQRGS